MSLISDLSSGAIGGLLSGIGSAAKDIRNALGGVDPDKKAEIELKLADLENGLQLAQTTIDLEDAKSEKWWKAGWRPFIGWVCGIGLAVQFFILPVLSVFDIVPKVPLDFSQLITLVIALLGMGTLRSLDKKAGVS